MLNKIFDINEISAWSIIFSLFPYDINKGVNKLHFLCRKSLLYRSICRFYVLFNH